MTKKRCKWVEDKEEIYIKYHDFEWGVPVYDDKKLYEMFLLECFQAGLSWITILKKRENFKKAFDNFDVQKIANYDDEKLEELANNPGIIRNRGKLKAAINNANIYLDIQKEFGSFCKYIWSFSNGKILKDTPENYKTQSAISYKISNDLKKRGMKYIGSITIYSYLEAVGIINNHTHECFKF
ncbi:DNA-3-methyladenine glycosylase 1 [Methanobrevibacter oralis]|uniref:DNA-3-methyladenine glycosylase 1 n=1 Tax=Methanobrevibacter oralis TaxID=66851 RepID=A0A166AUE7_METOA|nr:DNA-3-methyladenine glycosylase I [Methanobrevibacter oralis]KZX12486.1 DNA-3-methyladenine glycosylase 1 [Methanobrevibacter oralis]